MKAFKRIFIVLLSIILLLILFVVIFALVTPKSKVQLVLPDELTLFAHRGQVFKAPENTLEAVAAAVEEGFNAVEIDIRRTKDGELVLFHDHYTKTLLGVDSSSIENMLYEDLQQLNIIYKKKETNYKIPKLKDVFEKFPDIYYYLDIKEPSDDNIKTIVEMVRNYGMTDKVIISHANFFAQIKLRFRYPDIANCLEGFNAGSEKYLKLFPQKLQPTYFSSFLFNVSSEHINYLKKHNMLDRRLVYSVDEENMQQAIEDFELKYLIIDIQNRENVFFGK